MNMAIISIGTYLSSKPRDAMVISHTQAGQTGWGHFQATGGIVGLLLGTYASLKA